MRNVCDTHTTTMRTHGGSGRQIGGSALFGLTQVIYLNERRRRKGKRHVSSSFAHTRSRPSSTMPSKNIICPFRCNGGTGFFFSLGAPFRANSIWWLINILLVERPFRLIQFGLNGVEVPGTFSFIFISRITIMKWPFLCCSFRYFFFVGLFAARFCSARSRGNRNGWRGHSW